MIIYIKCIGYIKNNNKFVIITLNDKIIASELYYSLEINASNHASHAKPDRTSGVVGTRPSEGWR